MTREDIIKQAANGNADAAAFLRAFLQWAHWVDDVVDEPAGHACRTPEEIARVEAAWMIQLCTNPFFLLHREKLLPMVFERDMTAVNPLVDYVFLGYFIVPMVWKQTRRTDTGDERTSFEEHNYFSEAEVD